MLIKKSTKGKGINTKVITTCNIDHLIELSLVSVKRRGSIV